MKMVLVFDTDDREGMRTSMKMMRTILRDYATQWDEQDPKFGKIEFIKTIRTFMKDAEELEDPSDGTSLRFAKGFADKVWKTKNKGKRFS